MPFAKLSSSLFSAKSWHWRTPAALLSDLNEEFGFDLDPCPIGGFGGFEIPWTGRRVYCNPPYGPGIGRWLERGPEADVAVFLLPARTDTKWFHDQVLSKASEIRFIRNRLSFNGAGQAPFPSIVVVFRSVVQR